MKAHHRVRRPPHEPAAGFLLRTHALPLDALTDLGVAAGHLRASGYSDDAVEAADRSLTEDLRRIAADSRVARALYLSSASLFERLYDPTGAPLDLDRFARHRGAFLRYLTRMGSRATPFGASAGIATGRVGPPAELDIGGLDSAEVVVRLDAGYVDAIGQRFAEHSGAPEIPVRWNETARVVGDRLVFLTRRDGLIETSVQFDPDVRRALGEGHLPATFGDCVERIVGLGETVEDAQHFVRALMGEGAVVCAALGVVTETDPARHLASESWVDAGHRGSLQAALTALRASRGAPTQLESVRTMLPAPAPATKGSGLFHGALVFDAPRLAVPTSAARQLLATAEVLRRCPPPPRDAMLDRFAAAFVRRFGDGSVVRLLDLFDSRSGLSLRPQEEPAPSRADDWLTKVAMADRAGVVDVSELLPADPEAPAAILPDVFCVVATFLDGGADLARSGPSAWFHRLVGPSGAQYVGRFGHWHADAAALLEEMLRREQALRPDVVFAEICHQPPGREGNVVLRGPCHEYEISLLGRGTATEDRRIALHDLVVTVEGSRLTLWSEKLGRPVEPRLSCAHNFRTSDCAAYRFLGALQFQDLRCQTEWNWRGLCNWPELPRVVAGTTVLAPRQWRLRPDEAEQLSAARRGERLRALDRLRRKRGWERFVMVGPPTQPLLADLDTLAGAEVLFDELRRRPGSSIREADFFAASPVLSAPDGRRHHEAVVPLMRRLPAAAEPGDPRPQRLYLAAPQRHMPGGAWLFASIFCAPAAADELLTELVGPLATRLKTAGRCDRWFFLRYDEDGHHLRVRFHGPPDFLWGSALQELHDRLSSEHHLWTDVALREYHPEVTRYGGPPGLELAERLFDADSHFAVEALTHLPEERLGIGGDRYGVALAATARLLTDLGLDPPTQAAVVAATSTGALHHLDRHSATSRDIGRVYRAERSHIVGLLTGAERLPAALEKALDARSEALAPVARDLRQLDDARALWRPLVSITPSYMHMGLNRLFARDQRRHEFVVTELLARGYREIAARAAGKAPAARPTGR